MKIVEWGHYSLILSAALSFVQFSLLFSKKNLPFASFKILSLGQLGFIGSAFLSLAYAFMVSDFSVYCVAMHSHSQLPLLYKIAGVWGNYEGSMLLWVMGLSIFGGIFSLNFQHAPLEFYKATLCFHSLMIVFFSVFTLLYADPFERVFPIPLEGGDLNPLLQDPGLSFHPPLLYGGYTGFALLFSMALAILYRPFQGWVAFIRPWALLAWGLLSLGITSGSWWAYYELGWGGWWFWDPVENASLFPWLSGLMLLHMMGVAHHKGLFLRWTLFLTLLPFFLTTLGFFLIRSGIMSSVHTFAADAEKAFFFLGFLFVIGGGAFLFYGVRASYFRSSSYVSWSSQEGGLGIQNILTALALSIIVIGTLYPLTYLWSGKKAFAIGPNYFTTLLTPLILPFAALMILTPLFSADKTKWAQVFKERQFLMGAVLISITLGWCFRCISTVESAIGLCASIWILGGTLLTLFANKQSGWQKGMVISHLGFGLFLLAATINGMGEEHQFLRLSVGESADIAKYHITFEDKVRVPGPNYIANRAILKVTLNKEPIGYLTPERRYYYGKNQDLAESSIYTHFTSNLCAMLGDTENDQQWDVRLTFNPFAVWIWVGGGLMGIGGIFSLIGPKIQRLLIMKKTRRRKA
jgi:cytochrome c-type biogenesis protein CcmF